MSAAPNAPRRVTVIPGDGIGPEVIRATQRVIAAAGTVLEWEERIAGGKAFEAGIKSGVPQETLDSIEATRVVLKGPLATPLGKGEKSANVTLRKLFETYGNIRPVRELPGIRTPYTGRGVDLVVVRENVEDLYAGIEHMQTPDVAQALKIITRKGCEKIVRLAFELARSEGRTKVHCATKSNILKVTEGMLQHTFERIAEEYPEIRSEHMLVDNCAHQLVMAPEQFEVIVMTNMNGDIISDLASGLGGGLGFAPSANLGENIAIFEAVHGSAPTIAGKDIANPTAVLLSAVQMLRYLGEFESADRIENAIMVTLEDRVYTKDIAGDRPSVGTEAFTAAIIERLGRTSATAKPRTRIPLRIRETSHEVVTAHPEHRSVMGADVFIEGDCTPEELGDGITAICEGTPLRLLLVENRGAQVYPPTGGAMDYVDLWRARLVMREEGEMSDSHFLPVLQLIASKHRWTHVEKLHVFDGKEQFSKVQGQS